jgi:acylphosphatase
MIQRHIWVSGRVQGVGFRAFVLHEAKKYPQLKGYVRNLDDGRVEALFAGPQNSVLAMMASCKKGPSLSQVTHLEVEEEEYDGSLVEFDVA